MQIRLASFASAIAVALAAAFSADAAIAYNDFGATSTAAAGKFVSNISSGNSGTLVDYDTGATIGTLASSGGTTNDTGGAGADIGSPGTPLYNHFNGFIDLTNADWGSGQNVLTFSGLDPSKLYTVSIGINRGVAGPSNTFWHQELVIGGVDAFVNTSTLATIGTGVGTTADSISGPADAGTLATANNNSQVNPTNAGRVSTDGALVQFSNIDPGADGAFTVTLDAVAGNQYLNALSLEVIPEPASLALLSLGGLLLMGRRRA